MVSRDACGLTARRSTGPPWPAWALASYSDLSRVAFRCHPGRFDQPEHRNGTHSFALTVRLVYGGEANEQRSDERPRAASRHEG